MDCKKAESFLSFYVFDELTPGERVPITAHLQICGTCTRKLENYRVLQESLKILPAARAPSDFLVGVRSRLAAPETFVDRAEIFLQGLQVRRALTGASLATALGFAVFLGQTNQAVFQAGPDTELRPESPQVLSVASDVDKQLQEVSEDAEVLASNESLMGDAADLGDEPEEDLSESFAASDSLPRSPTPEKAKKDVRKPGTALLSDPERDRRSPAEAFDDDYGLPPRPALQIPEVPRVEVASAPQNSPFLAPVTSAKRTQEREPADMRRTQLPEKVMAAGVPRAFKADSGPGNLELMDARGLSGELDRLASTTLSSRVRSEAREGLSIFAPDGSSEDQLLARMTLETSSEDAFPAESPAALTEPQVRAVTLAWVRTVFGRRVQVQDIDASQDGPEVAREISVHTLTPQRFLTGLRDLVEAGLGFELKEVVFRKEQEVEVLLAFGTGIRGLDSLERFVENVRSLPQVEVTSDLSRRIPDGQSLYARFLVPNR